MNSHSSDRCLASRMEKWTTRLLLATPVPSAGSHDATKVSNGSCCYCQPRRKHKILDFESRTLLCTHALQKINPCLMSMDLMPASGFWPKTWGYWQIKKEFPFLTGGVGTPIWSPRRQKPQVMQAQFLWIPQLVCTCTRLLNHWCLTFSVVHKRCFHPGLNGYDAIVLHSVIWHKIVLITEKMPIGSCLAMHS